MLVTRAQPSASQTAARLEAAGFEPVALPLTKIAPLTFALPAGPFDAVVLTSPQALAFVGVEILTRLRRMPVFAVGGVTAAAAREKGFENVEAAGGDVASVAGLVRSASASGRLLYLCGKVRLPDLESELGRSGFVVTPVETYDTPPLHYSDIELTHAIGPEPVDAVIHMSRQSTGLFSSALADKFAPQFKDTLHICFSARMAEGLPPQEKYVVVLESPNQDSMISCLRERFANWAAP